jgi:hypothetical protein
MNTPIQELIQRVKRLIENDEALPFMFYDDMLKLLESMLEKEKDIIFSAYNNCELGNPQEYYNETFNTKE